MLPGKREARAASRGRAATAELDVDAYLRERAALVNDFLDRALPGPGVPPAILHRAMRHLLFPGGKRLRPALAFAGAEAAGAAPEAALPAAAAVELIHVYSLIHDDLPCMDDDAERRGLPTVHVAFDEATAVLAGDALLAAAFEVLSRDPGAGAARRLRVVADLAEAAGSRQLVGGQLDDLKLQASDADPARIDSVHRRKSAALIAASVVAGARLGGGDDALLARLHRFGLAVGVAFQIADDLLDEDADGACSLVRALGAEGARRRAEGLLDQALGEVADLTGCAEPLRGLARYAVRRDR